jgi:beta-phosphoglucomutase
MSLKGIVFDLNGTLIWDTHLHNLAWDIFLEEMKIGLTDKEKHEKLHGKNNQDILKGLVSKKITDEEIGRLILRKEGIYQELFLQSDPGLAPGAGQFLEYLKSTGIPYTIATASGPENLRFYFRQLRLERYFREDRIVYNNGKLPGKPDPHIFLKAMENLNILPSETVVFEDSVNGIRAAENAGSGMIVIVDSAGEDYSRWRYPVIRDFTEFDRTLLDTGREDSNNS